MQHYNLLFFNSLRWFCIQFAETPKFNPEAAILVQRGLHDYDLGSGHSPMRKAALPP
jgi:hypothetical protein